jgi:hypothetical protein
LGFVKAIGAKLVVIDNASDVFAADENARAQVRGFMRALGRLARETGAAVLLLVHVNKTAAQSKSREDYSGSTAWHNSARSRLTLERASPDLLKLSHLKSNHGPLAEPVELCWVDGVPTHKRTDLAAYRRDEAARREADQYARDAICALVGEFHNQGQKVYVATAGARTAWSVLSPHPRFPVQEVSRDRLPVLLYELQDETRLAIQQIPGSNRQNVACWVPVKTDGV